VLQPSFLILWGGPGIRTPGRVVQGQKRCLPLGHHTSGPVFLYFFTVSYYWKLAFSISELSPSFSRTFGFTYNSTHYATLASFTKKEAAF